jgi:hypothetical protein
MHPMLCFPDVPRSARAVIETVNEWLDGPALSVEQPEDGSEHDLFKKAENGTPPTVVFLCYILAYWRGSIRPGMIAHAWNDSLNGVLAGLVRN